MDSEAAEDVSVMSEPTDADITAALDRPTYTTSDMLSLSDAASDMLGLADAASLMREFSFLPPPDKVGCTPSMGMSMSSPTPGPSGSQVPTSQEVVEAMLAGRHQ